MSGDRKKVENHGFYPQGFMAAKSLSMNNLLSYPLFNSPYNNYCNFIYKDLRSVQ